MSHWMIRLTSVVGALALASSLALADGILDSLPSRDDNGQRRPPRDLPTPAPQPPAKPATTPPATDDLIKVIADLERTVQQLENQVANKNAPVRDDADLRKQLDALKAARARLADEFANADRDAARAVAERVNAFKAQFNPHVDALAAGAKPAEMDIKDWTALTERYHQGLATLAVETGRIVGGLQDERRKQLVQAERAIASLEKRLEETPNLNAQQRQIAANRVARIELELARRRLQDLRAIKAEYEGKESNRSSFITNLERVPGYDPVIDTIEWVARQMAAQSLPAVPTNEALGAKPALRDAVPGKEKLDDATHFRGRVAWLSRTIATCQQMQRELAQTIAAEDEEQIQLYEGSLRATGVEVTNRVAEFRKGLESSRPQRLAERRERLVTNEKMWREALERETAALDAAVKANGDAKSK